MHYGCTVILVCKNGVQVPVCCITHYILTNCPWRCGPSLLILKLYFGLHYIEYSWLALSVIRIWWILFFWQEPFSSLHIKFHDGFFDFGARMFSSLKESWKNTWESTSDVKVLNHLRVDCTPKHTVFLSTLVITVWALCENLLWHKSQVLLLVIPLCRSWFQSSSTFLKCCWMRTR